MLFCLDDLIFPPTLSESPAELHSNMLGAVSPIYRSDFTLSPDQRSHSSSISSTSTQSLFCDSEFDLDMAYQGGDEEQRRRLYSSPINTYYPGPAAAPQQTFYPPQSPPIPGQPPSWNAPAYTPAATPFSNTIPQNDIFTGVDGHMFPADPEVFPPTPQATEPPSWVLRSQTHQPNHLRPNPPPRSQTSIDSGTTSTSSLSRSVSPVGISIPATYGVNDPTYTSHLPTNLNHMNQGYLPPTFPPQNSPPHGSANSMSSCGFPVPHTSPQAWRCAYPNCSSSARFTRGCDLRKHFNRHSKHLYCRYEGCAQSEQKASDPSRRLLGPRFAGQGGSLGGGFSSKKDRARHEAKHNPRILCEWVGEDGERCTRKFSRVDNMKDHVRRIHRKGQAADESKKAQGTARQEGLHLSG